MNRDGRSIIGTIKRCSRLKCPACGGASIVARPFNLRHQCPACGVMFKREEGFFVGAIMANVVTTEVLILIVYVACLLFTNLDEHIILGLLFLVGISFPLIFYHHSWAFWLGMDHLIEGLPHSTIKIR